MTLRAFLRAYGRVAPDMHPHLIQHGLIRLGRVSADPYHCPITAVWSAKKGGCPGTMGWVRTTRQLGLSMRTAGRIVNAADNHWTDGSAWARWRAWWLRRRLLKLSGLAS